MTDAFRGHVDVFLDEFRIARTVPWQTIGALDQVTLTGAAVTDGAVVVDDARMWFW